MDKEKLLSRMMYLCSVSEHCCSDIRKKVERRNPEWADEIVGRLRDEGYIDERRYARAFARDKSALQGWGSAKIKLALLRKGISAEAAEQALGEIDTQASQQKLAAVLAAKWKALSGETDPEKKKAKLFRFAAGRGYSYEQILRTYDIFRRDQND